MERPAQVETFLKINKENYLMGSGGALRIGIVSDYIEFLEAKTEVATKLLDMAKEYLVDIPESAVGGDDNAADLVVMIDIFNKNEIKSLWERL